MKHPIVTQPPERLISCVGGTLRTVLREKSPKVVVKLAKRKVVFMATGNKFKQKKYENRLVRRIAVAEARTVYLFEELGDFAASHLDEGCARRDPDPFLR